MEITKTKKSLRLLLVEDSITDAALLQEYMLSNADWHIDLTVAASINDALEYIKNNQLDAVLLDLTLPDSEGLETVARIKDAKSEVPIVVLTGIDDENVGIEALRIGAQDYLVKGQVDSRFIIRSVDYAIERKKTEEALRHSEGRLRLSLSAAKSGAWEWDLVKNNGWLSPEAYDLLGIQQDFHLDQESWLRVINEHDHRKIRLLFEDSIANKSNPQVEFRINHPQKGLQWLMASAKFIYDGSGRAVLIIGIVMDINERKLNERERENTIEFLRIINKSTTTRALVRGSLAFFQKHFCCEAVAVRLKNADDYPYYETKGFPLDFVEEENGLTSNDLLGQIIRDQSGDPVLECMCGNVIAGKIDSAKPYFTQHGSFWTNSTSEFLEQQGTTAEKKRVNCNKCNIRKYESVALIPMRIGHERLGLMQLNDRRKGVFTPQMISSLERITNYFTVAISKFRSDEALHESKEDLKRAQEVAHLGSWRLDIRKNELTWSEESYRIFGAQRGTIQNYETFLDKVHPDDRQYVDEKWKAALKGEPYNIEHRIMADGKVKWVRERAALEFDKNGKLTGGFGTTQDISELKEFEEKITSAQKELQRANLELEDRVKERTRQLEKLVEVLQREIVERTKAETKLIENQDKLRELSSELIMAEERERRRVATHLHDSVGQLLAFSKKELGAMIKIAPNDIKESLQQVWEFIKQAVDETRTLTFDLSPSTLYAIGLDAALEELAEDFAKKGKFIYNFEYNLHQNDLLEQDKVLFYRSVRELLINIVKYSQAKFVDIFVGKINNKIRIVVKDDGVGFDKKELGIKKGKGGFGLYSIQERLETIGGNLKVLSRKGKGTTVILTAPLSKVKKEKE